MRGTERITVTDEDVRQLRREALDMGQPEIVALCDAALSGDDAAYARCEMEIRISWGWAD